MNRGGGFVSRPTKEVYVSIPKWANFVPEDQTPQGDTRLVRPHVNFIPENPSDDIFYDVGGKGGKREGVIIASPTLEHDPVRVARGEVPAVAAPAQANPEVPVKRGPGRPRRVQPA